MAQAASATSAKLRTAARSRATAEIRVDSIGPRRDFRERISARGSRATVRAGAAKVNVEWEGSRRWRSRRTSEPRPYSTLGSGLYLVATPIGNARDITLRALDVLAGADVLAAEDTRQTRKLLEIHGIKRSGPVVPYHDHNGPAQRPRLLAAMAEGRSVALVSDAGTPLVADPGYRLAVEAAAAGHAVTAVPGASALLAALAVAALPTDRFLFAGFLPPRQAARRRALAELAAVPATLVFYKSPRRLAASLADMAAVLGAERAAAVCRELTKRFEEATRAPLGGARCGPRGGAGPEGRDRRRRRPADRGTAPGRRRSTRRWRAPSRRLRSGTRRRRWRRRSGCRGGRSMRGRWRWRGGLGETAVGEKCRFWVCFGCGRVEGWTGMTRDSSMCQPDRGRPDVINRHGGGRERGAPLPGGGWPRGRDALALPRGRDRPRGRLSRRDRLRGGEGPAPTCRRCGLGAAVGADRRRRGALPRGGDRRDAAVSLRPCPRRSLRRGRADRERRRFDEW